jgi:hypothetical protein
VQSRFFSALLLTTIVAGCGGGGGGSSSGVTMPPLTMPPVVPPAAVNKSPGGIWHGFSTSNETLTLFVAETGDFRSIDAMGLPPNAPLPLFGSGVVLVMGDQLSGAYDSGRPFSTFAEHCELTGTLVERVSMNITLDCTDSSGVKRAPSLILGYDTDYGGGSSLATIAGNYTFPMKATNVLNIDGNGVIFGIYDNGPNCTVNGTAEIVDARYNLYAIKWQMSLCQAPFTKFEAAQMSGFGVRGVRGQPATSLLTLLTGSVAGHIEATSLLYQPP